MSFGSPHKINLQSRDLELLVTLFESRIMTIRHAAALHFDGRQEAAKKRIQKLKAAGFLCERWRRMNELSVLSLTNKSLKLLESEGMLFDYPSQSPTSLRRRALVSELTIRHELQVMDVKAAIYLALKRSGMFSVQEFSTWPALNSFDSSRTGGELPVKVRPDGFLRIIENHAKNQNRTHAFYLELDRSTETQEILASRCACYMDFYRSGGFAVRSGASRSSFKEYPFRVLIILQNAERRNNCAAQILQLNPLVLNQVWLSTYKDTVENPLGNIWIRPIDYREATKGTIFAPQNGRKTYGYRRQAEREKLIDERIQKHRLLQ